MSKLTMQRGPAKAIEMTPEQEAAAADKLAKARANRKAKQQATAEPGPESQSPAKQQQAAAEALSAPESAGTPVPASDDIEDTLSELGIDEAPSMAMANDERQPTTQERYEVEHARWLAQELARLRARGAELGLTFPDGTSHKMMRRKIEDAEAAAYSETAELTGPLAYQAEAPADEDFEAAKAAFDEAQRTLNELQAEQAGMPGQIDDAIEASDYEQLKAHRQRANELPVAIEVATLDMLRLRLAYQQMKAARSRVTVKETRSKATEATDELKRLQAKQYETVNAAEMARSAHDENVIAVGQTQREIDRLMGEMRGRR